MKYLEVGVFLLRSASDLPFFSASVSILPRRALPPCRRLKISFRKKEKFLAEENLFPCGRKNIFLRKEISLRAHGSFSPFGRRRFSFRRSLFFPSEEKKFSGLGKLIFLRRKNPLRSKEKSLAFEGKRSAVRRAIFFRTYGNKFSYVRKIIFLRTKILVLRRAPFLRPLKPSPSLHTSGLEKGRSEGRKSAWRKAFEAIGRYCLRCRIFAFHKSLGGSCPTSFEERPLPIKDNDAEIRYP